MTPEQVHKYLCNCDPRNPLYLDDPDDPSPRTYADQGCLCDNCFYERDKLAREILRLQEERTKLLAALEDLETHVQERSE